TESKSGVKRTSTKKFFPSYLFVEMELNDQTWHLVKNTPKITGLVGGGTRPSPVPATEVKRTTNQIAEGTLKPSSRAASGKLESGSAEPNKVKVGTVTKKQVEEIAKLKMPDLTAASLATAIKSIEGTARSMGIEVK